MGAETGIAWTDSTWNVLRGCSRVSEGCRHCYAEALSGRLVAMRTRQLGGVDRGREPGPYAGLVRKVGDEWRWTGEVRFVEEALELPLRWRRPRRIFVNSMSDLFHERVPDEWIWRVFDVMSHAGWLRGHTFQVLTKRPARMLEFMRKVPGELEKSRSMQIPWPPPRVHLGVSVENQATADERVPLLLQTPAAVRWISAEPLLGPLDLNPCLRPRWTPTGERAPWGQAIEETRRLDWVVVGGESGPSHRPMDLAWLQSIADQCSAHGVPLFVKQDSGPRPGLQGRIPEALWARREFPL